MNRLLSKGVLFFFLSLMAGSAVAAEFEKIFMPGPVITGHEEIEAECEKCHVNFEQAGQKALCLDCHDKVAGDLEQKQGFHTKNNLASQSECRVCHTDHIGRDADVRGLHEDRFNHQDTDFELLGGHRKVVCKECHQPETAYRDTSSLCIDCHKEDDVHKESLGKECETCHVSDNWTKVEFDHEKTEFPLKGKHQETGCTACHIGQDYKQASIICADCHSLDDKHQGTLGNECEKCHQEEGWDKSAFSHDKDTEFPLRKAHRELKCTACHPLDRPADDVGKTCVACHKESDAHSGSYGPECQECHRETKWDDITFDHDLKTEFKLLGRHKEITCIACHQSGIKEVELKKECIACHEGDDRHKGKQGQQCERCHGQESWTAETIFDHGLTDFPLIGLHEAVSCSSCHLDANYEETPQACVDCHSADDVHKGAFTDNCTGCHNPNGWGYWQFDHDQDTDYPLEGAHAGIACGLCHKASMEEHKESRQCVDCHSIDDVHQGQLGNRCERCHVPESFEIQIINNAR